MDKLILVYYVDIGNLCPEDVDEYINKLIERNKNENMVQYFVPVRDQETRIDCINPKLLPEDEYEEVREVIERQKRAYNNNLKHLRSENSLNFTFDD